MFAGVFCTARCSRIRSCLHWKNGQPKTSWSRIFDISCSYNTSDGFSWAMFSVKMSRVIARARDVVTLLLSFVVTSPLYRCLVANMALDRLASYGCMLTIVGFRLAAQTALTFILHVSLKVHREPASMFTPCPLPAEVQMSSVMKCFQPTRISVGRANEKVVFVQSRRQSLRAVALAAGRWSSSVVTNLFWHSPIVESSQFLTQASSSHGRRIWFPESRGRLCVWSKELLVESCVFSAVNGVFAGLTTASVRMHWKRGSHSRFVKDAASWPSRLVGSQSGQGSREAPGPSVPGCVRFAPSRRRLVWSVQARTRM